MKNVFVAMIGLMILAGCSKTSQLKSDLTGTWYTYKLTYQQSSPYLQDSVMNDSITFTSSTYSRINIRQIGTAYDTVRDMGTWAFQNSNGQVVLTDTSNVKQTFTVLNLTGNSVELLRNGYDYYLRKNPNP